MKIRTLVPVNYALTEEQQNREFRWLATKLITELPKEEFNRIFKCSIEKEDEIIRTGKRVYQMPIYDTFVVESRV